MCTGISAWFSGAALVLVACHAPPQPRAPAPPVRVGVGVVPAPAPVLERDASLVVPCTEAEGEAMRPPLDDLSTRFSKIAASDPVAPLVAEIEKVLATPCFALARIDADVKLDAFADAEAFRRWWHDGGESWLRNYIFPQLHSVTVAPTIRTTLTLENGPAPLRPLLCPLKAIDDGSCGIETAGWRMRLEDSLRLWHAHDTHNDYCAEHARTDVSGVEKYSVFRSCVTDLGFTEAMPHGVFQAPKDGWLVVGAPHMINIMGCQDAVSVYDLATGAAYLVSCRYGPGANGPSHPARLRIGRVPTGALREAAWMMMLQHTAESVRPFENRYDVPPDFRVARRAGEKIPSQRSFTHVDDDPVIQWAWLRTDPRGVLKGVLSGRFETLDHTLASHAGRLFDLADAAFQEGCAPASAPRIPWQSLGPRVDTPKPNQGELFEWVDQAKATIAHAPLAKPGCAMVP